MPIHPRYIGCDISKRHFDVFDPLDGAVRRFANAAEAAGAFAATIAGAPAIVVMEATGPYDRPLRAALKDAGAPYARVNPVRARRFAQAAGLLAKTDAVDARMLADYGGAMKLKADAPEDAARAALGALQSRRDQLVQTRADEKKRGYDATGEAARSIAAHLSWLNAEVARIDHEIGALVRASARLQEDFDRLRSAPGVGPVTAVVLLARMPELGRLNPKQIAALAGLAPVANDSGAFRGVRRIKSGRRRVRQALYMAALAAIRSCKRFAEFYDRIKQRAKAAKVAVIAAARKLLIALNAVLREQTKFI